MTIEKSTITDKRVTDNAQVEKMEIKSGSNFDKARNQAIKDTIESSRTKSGEQKKMVLP